jgi:transglutaminase-like putative cysteine protease
MTLNASYPRPLLRACLRLLAALLLIAPALPATAAPLPKLSAPPLGEQWFGVFMGDDRVGFAHLTISATESGYRIDTESSAKMHGIGFSRDADSRASCLVNRDLTLRSFQGDFRADDVASHVSGEVAANGVRVTVQTGGSRKDRLVKVKGAVYPPEALNMLPLLQARELGKKYKFAMFDLEDAKVKQVKVEVVGREELAGTPVVHLRNNLYPIVDNDIWVDLNGKTLKESVRDDFILTLAEEPAKAKLNLVEAALARKETVLAYSLVKVSPPIDRPAELKKLVLEVTGIPLNLVPPQDQNQQTLRQPDGKVVFTLPNPEPPAPEAAGHPAALASATAPELAARVSDIVGNEQDPAKTVQLLVQWLAKNVKLTDDMPLQTAQQTLKSRSGNSRSIVELYAALARSAGVATRPVAGLVYLPGQGFLFHCWAESAVNGWQPVDPALGQAPADLTHVKLVIGDSSAELAPLADTIGKLQVRVVERR